MLPITYNKTIMHKGSEWLQLAGNPVIRGTKILLRKSSYDKQIAQASKCSALDKLRNRKQFKTTTNRSGTKTLHFSHLYVPQDDGTFKLTKVA